jgi:hypothetical protein
MWRGRSTAASDNRATERARRSGANLGDVGNLYWVVDNNADP